jgi:hypothetical protein
VKIDNFKKEKNDNRTRVAATVTWEDSNRPTMEIYFETEQKFAPDISCNPHAFLVACLMPAMRFGEKRISIDAAICPELHKGLVTAMRVICNWYDWYTVDNNLVRIEGKKQYYIPDSINGKRAGVLFSGGIDSLATLRSNRLYYSKEHPGYIKDGLLVYGLEVREMEKFEPVLDMLSTLGQGADVTLVPVYTNIIVLGSEKNAAFWGDFWIHEYMGATFASIAHLFSNRLGVLSINSCHDIPNLMPYGSHPLLNPMYSSSDLRIRHEGIHLSRFEKVKLISEWDLALQHLRVCNDSKYYRTGMLNCANCEKCVRTMLALLACGVLEKTGAFPINNVNRELVSHAVHLGANTLPLYIELLEPLEKAGRTDLVHVIEEKISEFYRLQKKEKWRGRTIGPIKEFDRKYLNGRLKKLKNSIIT